MGGGGGCRGINLPKQTFHLDLKKDKGYFKKMGFLGLLIFLFSSNTKNPIENIFENQSSFTEERSWSLQFK